MQAGSSSEDENDFAIPETARVHKPGETFSDDSDVDKQDDEESDEDDGDNENDDAVPLTARVHKPGESFSDGSSEEDSDSERNTAAPTDQVGPAATIVAQRDHTAYQTNIQAPGIAAKTGHKVVPSLDFSPTFLQGKRKPPSKKAEHLPAVAEHGDTAGGSDMVNTNIRIQDEESVSVGNLDLETPRVAGFDKDGEKVQRRSFTGSAVGSPLGKKAIAVASMLRRKDPILHIRQQVTTKLRDPHGFIVEPEMQQMYREHQEKEGELRSMRHQKWSQVLKGYRVRTEFNKRTRWHERHGGDGIPPLEDLKKLCITGFPNEVRGKLWMWISGGRREEETSDGRYEDLLQLIADKKIPPECSGHLRTIECDLDRTFPTHAILCDEEGIGKLRRILQAYALHNPEIGYCQSMNFIAAFLLLHMQEAHVFYVLVCIVQNYLPGYFNEDMRGWLVDQRTFAALATTRLPKAAVRISAFELTPEILCQQWFLCGFVASLPSETVCRIWDAFLIFGSQVLFMVGLSTMEMFEKDLQDDLVDSGDIFLALRSFERNLFDADALLNRAFSLYGDVPKDMALLRTKLKAEVSKEFAHQRLADERGGRQRYLLPEVVFDEALPEGAVDFLNEPSELAGEEKQGLVQEEQESTFHQTQILRDHKVEEIVLGDYIPRDAYLEMRKHVKDLEHENAMMQQTLMQAQLMKEQLVAQFEAELDKERHATMEAQAAIGRVATQLEFERSQRLKAEAELGRVLTNSSGGFRS